jgi:hypothetical protein
MAKNQLSEPYHPHQNPVASIDIRHIKDHIHVLLDRIGAPEALWYMVVQYTAGTHNICSDPSHPDGMTPL